MYASRTIANEFIARAAHSGCTDLSPMKLQKLIYFAHGWYLANFNEGLIFESIQAWKFGPVIQSIYHDFKNYGNEHIDKEIHSVRVRDGKIERIIPHIEEDDENTKKFLDLVWERYGNLTPIQLSNMTHNEGSPWTIVTKKFNDIPSDLDIPNDLIKSCFKRELEE